MGTCWSSSEKRVDAPARSSLPAMLESHRGMSDVTEQAGARTRAVRILAISDEVDDRLYSPALAARFGPVDLLLSCGDLPYYYLDYVASMLAAPLYGVHGNHDATLECGETAGRRRAWGMGELHGRVVYEQG